MDVVSTSRTAAPLIVSLSGLAPGAPLAAAVGLVDALDARRVPVTLLAGPRPHPEVAAWVAARRRVGDAVLLHGTRERPQGRRPYRRLPAHEAGLRLAGALRAVEAAGAGVDGFAAPGWAVSPGTRRALAAAGLDVLLDGAGVHRLGADGTAVASRTDRGLVHVRLDALDAGRAGRAVDRALALGAVPGTAPSLLPARPAPARGRRGAAPRPDPEHWSITA